MRSTRIAEIIIVGSAFAGLFAFWLFDETRARKTVVPTHGMTNLVSFLELRTNVTKIRQFTKEGQVYFEVHGQYPPSVFKLNSGPPVYVFDESGRLIDWTVDQGDAPAFVRKWESSNNSSFISVEETKRAVKRPSID